MADSGFISFLIEQMEGFGPVSARRMFGGSGLFREGLMFGLVAGDTLYLKADATSRALFEAEGVEPFTYGRQGRDAVVMSYWRAPEACLEDPDEMARWCRIAFDAALRASAGKRKKKC